jgi:predicted DNA-binding transcriptional regulator AlpA
MSFRGGMPKPLPRVPHVESPFVLRAELLTMVPHSMATIDRLEARGQFPKRVPLTPVRRTAWVRREIAGYLRRLAQRRRSAAQEDHLEAANPELVARSKRSRPATDDQPANPDHQFALSKKRLARRGRQ